MNAERKKRAQVFLDEAGWGAAQRVLLAGDASFRKYERLSRDGRPAVLMDAPPPQEDVRPFVAITRALRVLGYSAPEILAGNEQDGFLLLEDLGDDLFARVIARDPLAERPLYEAAVDFLAALHAATAGEAPPHGTGPYDATRLMTEAALLWQWYLPALGLDDPARIAEGEALFRAAADELGDPVSVLVLRDFHAENLIWLPQREGHRRVGLLDYQDALFGHRAYDLVSLLQDARRDVSPALEEAMIRRYLAAASTFGGASGGASGTPLDEDRFRAGYAFLGAQRNAKIIGIFTRLDRRDGKPHYLKLIPRVWGLLERDLEHPALSALKDWFGRAIPEPGRIAPQAKAAA